MTEKKKIIIDCHICKNRWPYTGKNKVKAVCPDCRSVTRINKEGKK